MSKNVIVKAFHLSVIIAGLAMPSLAHADAVTNFHSDVTISRDNVATIKETITYDPQDTVHHGIYRFVPAQFKDADGHHYYTRVKLISVQDQAGHPYNIAASHNNRQELYLKIGDAHHTLYGPQIYVISYQISPLVVKTASGDRLTLNITGQDWETDIEQASATIKFAAGANIIGANCYTGYTGSTSSDCIASASESSATVAISKPLLGKQGLTADLFTSPGTVTTYLQPDQPTPFSGIEKAVLSLIGLGAILVLVAVLRQAWVWWKGWRERKNQTIIPQYEAPDGLKPAQLSILESPRSDVADITATIIDLAVRGFLKIDQIQAKTWYRQANYRFTKLKPLTGLAPFESELATGLFSGGDSIELNTLRNIPLTMSKAIQQMRKDLGKDLKAKGYFSASPTQSWAVFRIVVLGVAAVTLIVAVGLVLDGDIAALPFALAGLLASAVLFGLTYLKTGRTLAGNQEYAKVAGFKWFLSVTEKDRLAFTDAPEKTPELFSAMLPYAIALKVEKQWAKQFEGIDVAQAVGGWYGGHNGALFASSFTSDFSSSFGGAMSSSFAGASGGGSAGGGGGGGGGGGW